MLYELLGNLLMRLPFVCKATEVGNNEIHPWIFPREQINYERLICNIAVQKVTGRCCTFPAWASLPLRAP